MLTKQQAHTIEFLSQLKLIISGAHKDYFQEIWGDEYDEIIELLKSAEPKLYFKPSQLYITKIGFCIKHRLKALQVIFIPFENLCMGVWVSFNLYLMGRARASPAPYRRTIHKRVAYYLYVAVQLQGYILGIRPAGYPVGYCEILPIVQLQPIPQDIVSDYNCCVSSKEALL